MTVAGVTIPTIGEKSVKSFGKTFNSSLKDTAANQTIKDLVVVDEDRLIRIARVL